MLALQGQASKTCGGPGSLEGCQKTKQMPKKKKKMECCVCLCVGVFVSRVQVHPPGVRDGTRAEKATCFPDIGVNLMRV